MTKLSWRNALLICLMTTVSYAGGKVSYPNLYSKAMKSYRAMAVYLPEEYGTFENKRYSVIYYLHGAYMSYSTGIGDFAAVLDEMISGGLIKPVVLVAPDGLSGSNFGGTLWANSPLYGQVEDYVVEDVISYVDSVYRTIPSAKNRAIIGFSDGADGAMVTGLRHPHIYKTIAAHSGYFNWDYLRNHWRTSVLSENRPAVTPYKFTPSKGIYTESMFRVAGAYSANLTKSPYYVDFPLDANGNVNEAVIKRWKAYNADVLISALSVEDIPNIYFACGNTDLLNYPGNVFLKNFLDAKKIPYTFVPISGGHSFTKEDMKAIFTFVDQTIWTMTHVNTKLTGKVHEIALYDNYPNPFNPSTIISFHLSKNISSVQLEVYDIRGASIIKLLDGLLKAGLHSVTWNGNDQNGAKVASGFYFYQLRADDGILTKQMLFLQ